MIGLPQFLLITVIVGVVTAFLNIKFDRFFVMLLLLFVAGFAIKSAVDVTLWVIFLGAITILLGNKDKLKSMPKEKKKKFMTITPLIALIGALLGSYLFVISGNPILLVTFGLLTVLYGARLIFVHFKKHETEYTEPKSKIMKLCGMAGPFVSGISLGFIGTSLKQLKIPFAVRVGKMNLKQVYLGNTITAAYASFFAIILHSVFEKVTISATYQNFLLAVGLWATIHFISELTNLFVKDKWRKPFQVIIGLLLLIASVRVFFLI